MRTVMGSIPIAGNSGSHFKSPEAFYNCPSLALGTVNFNPKFFQTRNCFNAAYYIGGRRYFGCGYGELFFASITSIPLNFSDLSDGGLYAFVDSDVQLNVGVIPQRKISIVDTWGNIERYFDGIIGNEDRFTRRFIGGLRFGDIDQSAIGVSPDGMMHRYTVKLGPPENHPAGDRLPTAFLNYSSHIPITKTNRAQPPGALYLHRNGIVLYLSCRLLHHIILEWWCDFIRPIHVD